MEEALQNRLSVVANEVSDLSNNFVIEAARLFGNSFKVKIVGEKYETRSERLESLQLTTMENLGKAQAGDAEKLRAASVNLVATEGKWRQFFNDAQNLVNQFGTGVNRISEHVNLHLSVIEEKSKILIAVILLQASRMKNDTSAILVGIEKIETSLENGGVGTGSVNTDSLVKAIQVDLKPTLDAVHSLVNETLQSQHKLDASFREGWESLARGIDKGAMNVTDVFQTRLGAFETKMIDNQKLIQDQVCLKRRLLFYTFSDNLTLLLGGRVWKYGRDFGRQGG